MSREIWELDENPSKVTDYHWYSDDLPARKFYLFIAEIGRRLRHLMTEPAAIEMIELCEQCADGVIDEDQISEFAEAHRPTGDYALAVNLYANALYYWVADRYKVCVHGIEEFASDVFAIEEAVKAGILQPDAAFRDVGAAGRSELFASVRERTLLEWGSLVRCIYGPNPFRPVAFDPAWRSETVVALASGIYTERAFDRLPILADALEEAGCDHPDILVHCRGPGPHARGCWVVDLLLGKL